MRKKLSLIMLAFLLYGCGQKEDNSGMDNTIPSISCDSVVKITSTYGEEHDYYVDNRENLGQIHDGGFDAPAYIYEYGLPAYYDLIDSYNDLTPGQDYYYGEYLVEEGRNYYVGNGE